MAATVQLIYYADGTIKCPKQHAPTSIIMYFYISYPMLKGVEKAPHLDASWGSLKLAHAGFAQNRNPTMTSMVATFLICLSLIKFRSIGYSRPGSIEKIPVGPYCHRLAFLRSIEQLTE